MPLHQNLTGTDIHIVHAYTYADATARLAATGFVAGDVGKVAKQTDILAWYMLVNHSPIVWKRVIFGAPFWTEVVALTDAATIAVDASLGTEFTVTLGGNRIMGNPTNLTGGQVIIFRVKQDGTGSRTLTWGNKYRFSTDVAQPVLTLTAGQFDYIAFRYNAADDKLDCMAVNKGFA